MERPLRYSWILPGLLAVGERPRSYVELQSLGFRAVLSLQEEDEPAPEGEAPLHAFRRVPIRDGIVGGVPSTEDLARGAEAIAGFLARDLATYVHCYAGVGRSPTVCMAFLARRESLGLGEAFRRVAEAHPPTAPTGGQLAALAMFLTPESAP